MTDWAAEVGARRLPMLGTWVDAMDQEQLLAGLSAAIDTGGRSVLLYHNVNSLAIHQRDETFRRLYRLSDLVYIDGMAVVFMARALGYRVGYTERLAVLEWFWPLLEKAAAEGWRVLHIGSHQAVIDVAMDRIRERVAALDMTTVSGFFDHSAGSAGNERILDEIRARRPHILLVGMGMPLQEHWVYENLDGLPPCVVITVGGILGFVGGERPTAPRWMGRLGVEWVFRLATEPRRLWRRYLVEPRVLVGPMLRDVARGRRSRRPDRA